MINVNSTAMGGGVAELLQTLLAYARGVGVDARWFVIEGDPAFFEITKRIHNHLYGDARRRRSARARRAPATTRRRCARNADELLAVVRPGDVVLLHDPQTAALAPVARRPAGVVVWRCHVGVDTPNANVDEAWDFLRPYVEDVDAFVFSRRRFAPPWIGRPAARDRPVDRSVLGEERRDADRRGRLRAALRRSAGRRRPPGAGAVRPPRRVAGPDRPARRHPADRTAAAGRRPARRPGVALGPAEGHARRDGGFAAVRRRAGDAHLVLAGPAVTGVADDPESGRRARGVHRRLAARCPTPSAARVHLACTPMRDPDETAAIVNALQRHATVVVQKSLAEGFGLTVAEAMWKSRPVVASDARWHRRPDRRRRARSPGRRSRPTSPPSGRPPAACSTIGSWRRAWVPQPAAEPSSSSCPTGTSSSGRR